MSKVAIVYWSGTGNTAAMADAVEEGAAAAGAAVVKVGPSEFGPEDVDKYDAIAFGCPSMGDEVLEEDEYEPMFASVEGKLSGKRIALFGSWGWGEGLGWSIGKPDAKRTGLYLPAIMLFARSIRMMMQSPDAKRLGQRLHKEV